MFQIELSKCRWTTQGIDAAYIFPNPSMQLAEGPVLVSAMNDGNYFVHDGRYRCMRALLRGETLIKAEWLEDHEPPAPLAPTPPETVVLPVCPETVVLHTQSVPPTRAFTTMTGGNGSNGNSNTVTVEHPRYTKDSVTASCGKYHTHDPHLGCDGQIHNHD